MFSFFTKRSVKAVKEEEREKKKIKIACDGVTETKKRQKEKINSRCSWKRKRKERGKFHFRSKAVVHLNVTTKLRGLLAHVLFSIWKKIRPLVLFLMNEPSLPSIIFLDIPIIWITAVHSGFHGTHFHPQPTLHDSTVGLLANNRLSLQLVKKKKKPTWFDQETTHSICDFWFSQIKMC